MPAALASHRSGLALPAITQGHALAGAAMTVQCRRARRQGAQAPPGRLGYWRTLATPGRWCLIRSYLTSAANHGTNVLDAIRSAIEGALDATAPRHITPANAHL
jgi:hypothetical protein